MKKSLCASLAIVLTLGSLSSTRAQGSGMYLQNWKDILFGPMFTGGASINAGPVMDGTKTGAKFAFTGGGTLIFPWSPQIALHLTLGYDARGVNYHNLGADSNVDLSVGYLALRPEIRMGGFLIGLGLGMPMSTSTTGNWRLTAGTAPPTSSDMGFLLEGRLGADLVLSSTDASQIHLLIEAAYPFSKILKSNYYDPLDDTKNNGPLATAQIGISYLFDMTPH